MKVLTFGIKVDCSDCGRCRSKGYNISEGTTVKIGCASCQTTTVEFTAKRIVYQILENDQLTVDISYRWDGLSPVTTPDCDPEFLTRLFGRCGK